MALRWRRLHGYAVPQRLALRCHPPLSTPWQAAVKSWAVGLSAFTLAAALYYGCYNRRKLQPPRLAKEARPARSR